MRKRFFVRPFLELLEDRWVPSTTKFYSGLLQVYEQTPTLAITQTANNTFGVKDGPNTVTYSGVSSIQVIGTTGNDSIKVTLGAFTYSGSLLVNSGNGNDTIDLRGGAGGATGGTIRGPVTLLTGLGNDSISVDKATTVKMVIGGTFTAVNTAGNDSITFGNSSAVLKILGDVNLSGVNTIRLNSDQANVFAGNFNASVGGIRTQFMDIRQDPWAGFVPGSLPTFFGGTDSTIGKSMNITGGATGIIKLLPPPPPVVGNIIDIGAMQIMGNLTVNFPGATAAAHNDVFIADHASGVTTIHGNFTYWGSNITDIVDLASATYLGNVTLYLGSSDSNDPDAVAMDTPFNEPMIVNGNLTINATGDLDAEPLNPIQAYIGGNMTFNLGDGNSTITFDQGPSSAFPVGVQGKVIIRAGNGDNILGFLNSGQFPNTEFFNVDVIYGNGNNDVTLNNPDFTLTGSIVAGTGDNHFHHLAGTLVNFTLVNFT
jgi:hypothetical protein